jgi:adenylate cyclase
MARVFLSYARDDLSKAQKLASALTEAGHEIWWDFHVQGGSRFSSEIDRALKNAEVVVVLWTPASVKSAWVQDEAGEGRDSGRLVPVALDSTKPPLGFRQFQCVNLSAWTAHGRTEALHVRCREGRG